MSYILSKDNWKLATLCLLILVERIYNFVHFNLDLTDSDQPLFWLGAVEMKHGHFHEPSVYGQSYNTFFESFLAVPLLFLGMLPNWALPLITNVLTLTSIFLLIKLAIHKKNIQGAEIIAAFFLLMPAEFMFITSMPRGFITGIFAAICGIYTLEVYSNKKVWIGGLLLSASLALNPNALLILIPYGIYKFQIWKNNRQLLPLLLSSLPALTFYIFKENYYYHFPEHEIHPAPSFNFKLEYFTSLISIEAFPKFYGLGPIIYYGGPIILVFLIIAAYHLRTSNRNMMTGITILLITIPLLFGFAKIQDGEQTVFFPASRMFLALPFVLAFAIGFIDFSGTGKIKILILIWLVIIWVSIKCLTITLRTERALAENGNVMVVELFKDIHERMHQITQIATINHTEKVLLGIRNDFYLYGIPALSDLKIKTLSSEYERRLWGFDEIRKDTNHKALFIGKKMDASIPGYQFTFITKCHTDSVFLIEDSHREKPFEKLYNRFLEKRKSIR